MDQEQKSFNERIDKELHENQEVVASLVERVTVMEEEQVHMKTVLTRNTEIASSVKSDTQEMLATFKAWQGAMKTLEFVGRMAKPVTVIAGMIAAIGGAVVAVKTGLGWK